MNAPTPIEIDPNPCELCGRLIDQHRCVDDGDGPEFFCWDDGDLVKLWELSDPRDSWKHTGEKPPSAAMRNSIQEWPPKRPYVTPKSTKQAFLYVARNHDAAYLARWLERHPQDVETLTKLWAKNGNS